MTHKRPTSKFKAAILSVGFLGATLFMAQAQEQKALAIINGEKITERELALAEADLGKQFGNLQGEQRKAAILNALIDIRSLAAEAENANLDDNENFKARMAFQRARALHNVYFQENVVAVVTDAEIRDRYEKEVAAIPPTQEFKASHILVEEEATAKEIIKMLDDGADFAELAKTKSTGPSGPNGGDLGYFGKGRMVPEFEAAVIELEKGKHTAEPVKTQFGYHVIIKTDERTAPPPAFDAVKDQVRQLISQEKYVELTKAARKRLKVEVLDEALKAEIEKVTGQ